MDHSLRESEKSKIDEWRRERQSEWDCIMILDKGERNVIVVMEQIHISLQNAKY